MYKATAVIIDQSLTSIADTIKQLRACQQWPEMVFVVYHTIGHVLSVRARVVNLKPENLDNFSLRILVSQHMKTIEDTQNILLKHKYGDALYPIYSALLNIQLALSYAAQPILDVAIDKHLEDWKNEREAKENIQSHTVDTEK